MRYARVESILESESAFKTRMSEKSEAVIGPNGERRFSPEVIKVTENLHKAGKDAHKAPKLEIIRVAMTLFQIGKSNGNGEVNGTPAATGVETPVVVAVATPETPPASEPAAPVAEAPVAKPAPAAPKPKVAVAPKAAVNKATVVKKPTPAVKAPEAAPVAAAPAATPAPAPVQEKPVATKDESNLDPAYNPYISMYSLSLSLIQMVDRYDTDSGKAERLKTLDKLAVDLRKLTKIKEPARAQEIKKH